MGLQQTGPVVAVRLTVGQPAADALRKEQKAVPTPIEVQAMIDTGATGTVVSEEIVSQLGLHPVGRTRIHTPSSDNVPCPVYLVRLMFPNNVIAQTVAIGAPLRGQPIQCLVGRDVLQHSVFIYIGYTDTFTLSF